MTHLARGDEPDHPLNARQAAGLDMRVEELRRAGAPPDVVHVSNSAAGLTRPDLSRDYGAGRDRRLRPHPDARPGDFGLIPAMTLYRGDRSGQECDCGQGISYNHTWTAPADTVIGVVACGYADGVPRLTSIGSRYASADDDRNVGRICMDQFVVELGADDPVWPRGSCRAVRHRRGR